MSFSVSWVFKALDNFTPNAKKIEKSMKGVKRAMIKLGEVAKKTGAKIRSAFSDKLVNALSFAALAAAVTKAGRSFMTFEDNLAELNAIVGPTEKELADLSKSSLQMGIDASVAGAEVLRAFKLVASAKPELLEDIPALKDMTKHVLILANASGMNLADASKVAAESLNIFGKDASHAARFIDIMAAGAKFGSSEIAQTGEAVLKAGAAAKIGGIGFKTLNASIQILSSSGLKAEIAGTGLNAVFSKLAATGIPALDTKGGKLVKVLKTLGKASLTAKEMVTLFGLENIKTAQALIENADKITAMEEKLGTSGIAAEQAGIRLATMSRKLDKIGTIVEQKVVKAFTDLSPLINENMNAFTDWIGSIQPADIENFVETLKGLFWAVGKVVDIFKVGVSIIKVFGELIGQVAGSIATLDFTPFDIGSLLQKSANVTGNVLDLFGLRDEPKAVTDTLDKLKEIDKMGAMQEKMAAAAQVAPMSAAETAASNRSALTKIAIASAPPAANDMNINNQVGVGITVNDPGKAIKSVNATATPGVALSNPKNVAGGG